MTAAERVHGVAASLKPKVGIGSSAYRYAIGFSGFDPGTAMSIADFLDTAARDGWGGVQLCENLVYASRSDADLTAVAAQADRFHLFVEVAFNGLTEKKLNRHLDLAEISGSDLIRVVVGNTRAVIHREQEAVLESRDYLLQELSHMQSVTKAGSSCSQRNKRQRT